MRMDPDYVTSPPNWTHGIVVGEFSTKTDTFAIHETPFIDGALRLGLQRFPAARRGRRS
jgi:hypothetical protein